MPANCGRLNGNIGRIERKRRQMANSEMIFIIVEGICVLVNFYSNIDEFKY
jgi:hypothetical protein